MGILKQELLITLVILNIIALVSATHIYQELHGDIISKVQLNFSILVKRFSGVVFYGVDTRNNFLIELEENGTNNIILKFNQGRVGVKSIDTCGCFACVDLYMTFHLQLYRHLVEILCNNISTELTIPNEEHYDQFRGYPIPRNLSENIIFIWMGNIGPYMGEKGIFYHALKKQLTGCLDKFYFNNKLIKNQKRGKYFSSPCFKNLVANVCIKGNCFNRLLSFNMSDCSTEVLNSQFCKKKMVLYPDTIHSYTRKNYERKSISLKLEWKQLFPKSYCLMEFSLRNTSLLTFYINRVNEIVMHLSNSQTWIILTNVISKIYPNTNNVLYIHFNNSDFIIKIYNETFISTYIEQIAMEPSCIVIGKSRYPSLCKRFEGAINFQFNSSEFTPIPQTNENSKIYYLIVILFESLVILTMLTFVIIREFTRYNSTKPGMIYTNSYEDQYLYPSLPSDHYESVI